MGEEDATQQAREWVWIPPWIAHSMGPPPFVAPGPRHRRPDRGTALPDLRGAHHALEPGDVEVGNAA